MLNVKELIREDEDGISFGDFSLGEKTKKYDFDYKGDLYNIKSWKEITRLDKNDFLEFESLPGSSAFNYHADGITKEFYLTGQGETQVTIRVEAGQTYLLTLDDTQVNTIRSDISAKITFSAELNEDEALHVVLEKC